MVYTYDSDGDDNACARRIRYIYESAYRNLVRVKEWAADGAVMSWTLSTLITTATSDTEEPYEWRGVSAQAGTQITDDLKAKVLAATSARLRLVDRFHPNIDWEKLRYVNDGVSRHLFHWLFKHVYTFPPTTKRRPSPALPYPSPSATTASPARRPTARACSTTTPATMTPRWVRSSRPIR